MILVCGDFHGLFSHVNKFLARHQNISIILQCGDFGYWPKFFGKTYVSESGKIKKHLFNLKNKDTKIFWCDGNHEDHESLNKFDDCFEVSKNCYYMPRGSILQLPDKRKVLFIGGAFSIDRKERILGYDYFLEETITQRNIEELPDENIDIVISHTAPRKFKVVDYHEDYDKDPSRDALDYVFDKYKPSLWYFGHMHIFKQGKEKNCKWTCLNGIGLGKWWIPLDNK